MNEYFSNNSGNNVQRHSAHCEYGGIKMLYFIIIIIMPDSQSSEPGFDSPLLPLHFNL